MKADSDNVPAIVLNASDAVAPALIAARGRHAGPRFVEFFTANIRNPNTRKAYYRSACEFFEWCDQAGFGLLDIEPVHEHAMSRHHNLETYLQDYIEAAGLAGDREGSLFRTSYRRTGLLTNRAMTQSDVWRMLQRRASDAGIPTAVCNHTFRATGITAYLDNGGSLENAQAMAAHESPRTTKLYDRTDDQITLDEVEKIGI